MSRKYTKAPFPYYGGKSRIAAQVWEAFGKVDGYCEPFFGSGAVLLANPNPPVHEVICDLSPHIYNFWRAIQFDPIETAKWADSPNSHMDLHARHVWLVQWARDNRDKMWNDPDHYSAKAAGWYAWAVSSWIGGRFAADKELDVKVQDARPHAKIGSGQGIQQQTGRPGVEDGRPYVHSNAKRGVTQKPNVDDKRPVTHMNQGQGVQQMHTGNRDHQPDALPYDGSSLHPWFLWLHERLRLVTAFYRGWESGVSKIMTMHHESKAKKTPLICGVFLDPPYLTSEGNRSDLYESDCQSDPDKAAHDSYEWAVEHGKQERFRIAYCCRRGDFPLPEGWSELVVSFAGVKKGERSDKHKDHIMLSPHCWTPPKQLSAELL